MSVKLVIGSSRIVQLSVLQVVNLFSVISGGSAVVHRRRQIGSGSQVLN